VTPTASDRIQNADVTAVKTESNLVETPDPTGVLAVPVQERTPPPGGLYRPGRNRAKVGLDPLAAR
jgi:hypothetical protein